MSAPLAHSAHCPFCKQPISAELAQYGGNCPKCMLEIPGEDAPTDPGAQVRARQESERAVTEKRSRRRGWVVTLVGTLAAATLVGVGAWRYQQEREALTYDLDDYYVMPLEDIAAAPEAAAPPVAVASIGGTQTTRRGTSSTTATTGAPPEGTVIPTTARAPSSASLTGDSLPPEVIAAMAASGGSVSLGSATIGVSRPDAILSDPTEIYDMIKRVLQTSGGQLHACYEQRLKQTEDLRGTWNLEFTVGTDGVATRVRAKGAERADPELERCMVHAVSNWRFMRVNKPQPVQKPYRFAPAY